MTPSCRAGALACLLIALACAEESRPEREHRAAKTAEEKQRWAEQTRADFARWFESPATTVRDLSGGCRAWTDTVTCELFFASSEPVIPRWRDTYRSIPCEEIENIIGRLTSWQDELGSLACIQSGSFSRPGSVSGLVHDPSTDRFLFWATYLASNPPPPSSQGEPPASSNRSAPPAQLCADWPRRIEPDMQMPERAFSDEAADAARRLLARIEAGELEDYDWTVPANAEKVIEGNTLWRAAQAKSPQSLEVGAFCRYLVEQGFYYD